MRTLNVPALLFAVALSLGMTIVGGLLTGNQLFYPALLKARTKRRMVSRETP